MPYKNKEMEKQRKHEIYLLNKQILINAKLAANIPLDKRLKHKSKVIREPFYGKADTNYFANIVEL